MVTPNMESLHVNPVDHLHAENQAKLEKFSGVSGLNVILIYLNKKL